MSTQTQQRELAEIVSRQEVARRLGVSTATIKRADENGVIPGFRVNGPGSSVRYVWSEVLEALRSRKEDTYVTQ